MFDRDAMNRLYRYAYALTGHQANAYDLLQSSLERLLRADKPELRNPEAYAMRTIRNAFNDDCRKQNRSPETVSENPDTAPVEMQTNPLESTLIAKDELESIWQRLEPKDREILYFWAVEGMTAGEIAQRMESRRGTILSRIHRLRIRLRQETETALPGSKGSEVQL